ncbi:MAG: hypothetical protein LBG84_10480 [Treponema sp.]|jgi:hypothetical protein|nr:hypothetical protein [Treponema sp.]
MKKLLAPVFAVFVILGVSRLEAQQSWGPANTSELYYVTVHVEKVYPARLGYMVVYRVGVNQVATAYVPYTWFHGTDKKAALIQYGDGQHRASMSIYYKEKAFHLVKLYVPKRPSDLAWGSLLPGTNLDDRFEGVEEIKLGYPAPASSQ